MHDIVTEAVVIEKEFLSDALPVGLIGINANVSHHAPMIVIAIVAASREADGTVDVSVYRICRGPPNRVTRYVCSPVRLIVDRLDQYPYGTGV